ncbi:hypothetical protein CEUSTIGMA_g7338.t1 [Chlamydomonas eustigma]|uniref:protein-tyrosine-phosphatase n=1 Tax=Chlamydomonas eustigma TaxID=1157962 RepID=A0A250X9Z3_9CHLO|nr:hypothetical protein CEUSTIGMA_g7338.t1 [Chlamydomonas eustigma]|eukprot:GAX79898.1 hypothetical protein CEUSTIGMA_g7338.t1 [Chlamydomonas eustigma]
MQKVKIEIEETSISRPISVSWIVQGTLNVIASACTSSVTKHASGSNDITGKLGLSFCPGKQHKRGGRHIRRDLDTDLAALKHDFLADCIVCLLNDSELRSYNLREYSSAVQRHGKEYVQFPIIECAPPENLLEAGSLIQMMVQQLMNGRNLVMHCRGGVGRAGMMAACLLLYLNLEMSPLEAIRKVRSLRCKAAVETRRQEDFVAEYAKHLRSQDAANK